MCCVYVLNNVYHIWRGLLMKVAFGVASLLLAVASAFRGVPFRGQRTMGRSTHLRGRCSSSRRFGMSTDEWIPLPVNPSAGKLSRTVPFNLSGLEDLQRVERVLRQNDVRDASVVIIPSWRHHLIQYDGISAALEALKIPTTVTPLPDGLWASLLQRLQVHALRRAAKYGILRETIVDALVRPFAHLDKALRTQMDRGHGRRIIIIASDDSAWLIRAFVNSRSAEWLAEVPLETAVLVGGYHKSIVGELVLDVYPRRPRDKESIERNTPGDGVMFFSLNGRENGRAEQVGEGIEVGSSISCMSFEEDSESCIVQEFEVEGRGCLSLLGSTSLLSLWVPRVLQGGDR